ncbi:hypothetical protein L345_13551, partial [Ophiophagus hannah]
MGTFIQFWLMTTSDLILTKLKLPAISQTPRRGLLKVPPPNRFPKVQIRQ